MLALALVLMLHAVGRAQPPTSRTEPAPPIVILISIDGWRWDYLERFAPPTLTRLASSGVRAAGLVPVFPSKTFPNHYTIVTGLYPNRHGIVSNSMMDPALPGRFTLSNRDVQQDTRWWGGEPIWVTAERQGQIAATMFWPGSDAEIAGDRPTYWRPFDNDLPNAERVDQLLVWLQQPPASRPTFLTLYFSAVDTAGHTAGPDGAATREAALEVDRAVARLVDGVSAAGLMPRTHWVLVSDHGMAALAPERTIVLDDYVDPDSVDVIDWSPIVGIRPLRDAVDTVYAAVRNKHPALQIYRRDELPDTYRLRDHPRLAPIIGIAEDGWHVTARKSMKGEEDYGTRGNHGYDPRHQSMHGLFVATGPQFRRGMVVPAFDNVHVYELMCRVLGLRPAPNDGAAAATAAFFR